jgi:hypothetical protein
MKKITVKVFLGLTMLTSFISSAQFAEGFESGATIPATWTVLNGGDAGTYLTSTLTPHGGTREAAIVYDEAVAHDDYLVTPAITVTAGVSDRFSCWLRSRDPLYPETIDIVLSTTTPTAAAFTTALEVDVAPPSGASFFKYSYDLTPYLGQTVYIAFHSTTLNLFVMDIDDVVNDALPFCSEPIPNASEITETSATVNWSAIPGSLNYEYVLDNNAADPAGAGTATTALTYNAGPLTASTTYYFHIRNNCDGAGFSSWTTISITTASPFTGCLTASGGLYPTATYTPATCDGIVANNITTLGYAGEYSNVNVTSGQTYTFKSSIATDYITISNDDGVTGVAYGLTPVTWVATADGVVRFYTHTDADCGEEEELRTRSVTCGIPACTLQAVTFGKVTNCPGADSFNVTANITNLGSAASITVTDNQGGTPQVVTGTGVVTFGPYANGTSVILTTTNTDSPTCVVASTAQTQVACPPLNDSLANAEIITCGTTYTGSTAAANLDEDNAPDGFGADMDAPNVWYNYTGTGTPQTVTLNLCTSAYDTSVLVYTGTSGALTLVAANDDENACGVGFTSRSKVNFTSDGTTTYHIAIEGWNVGSTGAYSMAVTCSAVTPPAVANQTCGTALAVNVDNVAVNSDNSFGDASATQPSCDTFGTIQDVWFSFVATSPTVNVLVTNGTMTSSNFNVYSGACGGLTALTSACNADLTAPTTESFTTLTTGTTYYVQVWSSSSEQGTFSLKLSDPNMATNSFESAAFKAYPNPVKNILNLSYDKNISNVAVFNLLGQQVITKTVGANQSQVDMSHLASGTYMVKVTAENQVKTIKVVKE